MGGNYSYSIFKLQKRTARIITGVASRDTCRELFKILFYQLCHNIIPFVNFVVNNKNQFQMNSEIHSINTRNNSDFYEQLSHLTIYQQGPIYMGIKVYNCLIPEIKELSHNIKKFKSSLRFLHQHSFYKLAEYLNYQATV